LAPHCGPDDILTPVSDIVPGRNCAGYSRHASAREIRQLVGDKIWNEYFVFTIERNPWDKILSRYWAYAGHTKKQAYKEIYTKITGHKMGFPGWFRMKVITGMLFGLGHIRFPRHYHCYTEDERVCVDFIARFESRAAHLKLLSERIGIEISSDIHVGAQTRQDRRPYTCFYTPWMQRTVERVFAKDLALLGYRYGETPPTDPILNGPVRDGRAGQPVSTSTS
jgi:hypothetical protein